MLRKSRFISLGFAKSLLFNKLKVKIGYKIGVLKIIVRKR